jgi:hypothetical protein
MEEHVFTENPWFQAATLAKLYLVYAEALQELRAHSDETSWEGSDDDMLALASRILDIAFTGERDAGELRRGAMRHFGHFETSDPAFAAA